MLKFIRKIFRAFHRVNWIPINYELVGKDNIFKMKFDENWFYSVSGNSYYSIHNQVDDLKGGIQFSIIWNRPVVDSIKDLEHLDSILKENEQAKTTRVQISGIDAIYFATKYLNNNMDCYYWYMRFDKTYVKISFFIFEEEPLEIREKWLNRVNTIINTLEIDKARFKTIRMK